MLPLILFTLILISVALHFLSSSNSFANLRNHPFNLVSVLSFFFFIVFLDFLSIYIKESATFSFLDVYDQEAIASSGLLYVIFGFGAIIGIVLSGTKRPSVRLPHVIPGNSVTLWAGLLILLGQVAFLLGGILLFDASAVTGLSSLEYAISARGQFYSQNPLLAILAYSTFPVYLVSCGAFRERNLTLFLVITIAATFAIILSGSRGRLLLLLVFALGTVKPHILSRRAAWSYTLLPFILFILALLQYLFRDQAGYDNFLSYLREQGGLLAISFDTSHIAFAEVPSLIFLYPKELPNGIFPLVTAIFAFVPRMLMPLKGYGTSAAFTEAYFPGRLFEVRSEYTVGGVLDAYLIGGGLFGLFLLSLVLGVACNIITRRAASDSPSAPCQSTLLLMSITTLYTFLRGDLFNAALFLYGAFFAYLLLSLVICLFSFFAGGGKW